MGDYKAQYERYYGNVKRKAPGKTTIANNGFEAYYGGKARKSKGGNRGIVNMFIWQLVGTLFLLAMFLGLKMIPIEGTEDVYAISKQTVESDFNISEAIIAINIPSFQDYKEITLDYIDQFKSMVTGTKTLKESIKDEYVVPVIGEYKDLSGEDKGIEIITEDEKDVFASYDGKVEEVSNEEEGSHIIINHDNGVKTYYGLISNVNLKVGDEVKKGESIGKTGAVDDDGTNGIVYKIIYMDDIKNPVDLMDFSGLKSI